jgi:hypothetical protein
VVRFRSQADQAECLDIATQINIGVCCGHINPGNVSLARRDEGRKDWRRVRMPEGSPVEYKVCILSLVTPPSLIELITNHQREQNEAMIGGHGSVFYCLAPCVES